MPLLLMPFIPWHPCLPLCYLQAEAEGGLATSLLAAEFQHPIFHSGVALCVGRLRAGENNRVVGRFGCFGNGHGVLPRLLSVDAEFILR